MQPPQVSHKDMFLALNERYSHAMKIILREAEDNKAAITMQVILPYADGMPPCSGSPDYIVRWGRKRWLFFAPHATPREGYFREAPAELRDWNCTNYQLIWNQIQGMFPAALERRYGSHIAALQLLVDRVDHLILHKLLQPSATMTALLILAESHLTWPEEFCRESEKLRKLETAGHFYENHRRGSAALPRIAFLTSQWLKLSINYWPVMEVAAKMRTELLQHLQAMQSLCVPITKTTESVAPPVVESGLPSNPVSAPVPPETPTAKLVTIWINRNEEVTPLFSRRIKLQKTC